MLIQMSMLRSSRAAIPGRALVAIVAIFFVDACGRTVRLPLEQPTPRSIAELWREPTDLESRDLFHGPGGQESMPQAVASRLKELTVDVKTVTLAVEPKP